MNKATLFGAGLVVVYTAVISSADAITKLIAGGYAAPQLFAMSALIVMGLSFVADRSRKEPQGLRTRFPRIMALRAVLTVAACTFFFYAFRDLPFADVFVFIGLMPILAGLMSGPILGEHVRAQAWLALGLGFVGVVCLFPGGIHTITTGHWVALMASVTGTASMVLARYIGREESNALAQVFYPNLGIFVAMAVALPFVYKPMPLVDLGWVAAYAVCLFFARWILVEALRRLAAYVATPLMNLQFVWMVLLGAVFFQEMPSQGTYLGVAIVVASGLYLLWDQMAETPIRFGPFGRRAPAVTPAE